MRGIGRILAGGGFGLVLLAASGCRLMDSMYRGTISVIDPDRTRLVTGTKWVNPMPNLRPLALDKRVVYLHYRNSSGSPLPDLGSSIRARFEANGYRVTLNPEEASYLVQVDTRHFGESRTRDGNAAMLGAAAIGGVAGGIIGHNVGDGSGTNTAVGAGIGAAALGGTMYVMANRNKMVEFDLVLDVRVGERVQGGIVTNRSANETQSTSHSAGVAAAGGSSEHGTTTTQSREDQAMQVRDDFYYHSNRLTAYAVRMGLTPDEAMPVLADKLVMAMGGLLP